MEAPDEHPHAPALTPVERIEAEAQRLYNDPLPTASERKAERKRAFIELCADGLNYSEAAEALGVHRLTAYNWRREDPAFEQACRDAFKTSVERLEQHVEKRAFQSDKVAMWLLERRAPEKYHIAQKLEHSGAVDLAGAVLAGRRRAAVSDEPGSDLC